MTQISISPKRCYQTWKISILMNQTFDNLLSWTRMTHQNGQSMQETGHKLKVYQQAKSCHYSLSLTFELLERVPNIIQTEIEGSNKPFEFDFDKLHQT